LDIHVRTRKEHLYSLISAVSVKLGDKTFEVNHEDLDLGAPAFYYNGELTGGISADGFKEGPFSVSLTSLHNEDFNKDVLVITIHLQGGGSDDKLTIHVMDQFMFLHVNAISKNVVSSSGLAGSYPEGLMLGRDGSDLSYDRNAYGADWQVLPDEPKLFHSTPEGFPQAPHAGCALPEIDAHEYLRTANAEMYQLAVKACQEEGVKGASLDDCIFDVVILSNPAIAAAWWGSSGASSDAVVVKEE